MFYKQENYTIGHLVGTKNLIYKVEYDMVLSWGERFLLWLQLTVIDLWLEEQGFIIHIISILTSIIEATTTFALQILIWVRNKL